MSKQLLSRLTQATISTFEDLGFVLPSPEIDDAQASVPLALRARVGFVGPVRGWLEVRVTDDVATELAANMLGVDGAVGDAVKRDALGEIANVICGNVVPSLGTARDVFDLEMPALASVDRYDFGPRQSIARLELGVEAGRAVLELFVERGEHAEDAA